MVDQIKPVVFEKPIAILFRKMGYEARATKLSGDQGVDVIAEKLNRVIAIQAKLYSNPVGNSAIQEVVA